MAFCGFGDAPSFSAIQNEVNDYNDVRKNLWRNVNERVGPNGLRLDRGDGGRRLVFVESRVARGLCMRHGARLPRDAHAALAAAQREAVQVRVGARGARGGGDGLRAQNNGGLRKAGRQWGRERERK